MSTPPTADLLFAQSLIAFQNETNKKILAAAAAGEFEVPIYLSLDSLATLGVKDGVTFMQIYLKTYYNQLIGDSYVVKNGPTPNPKGQPYDTLVISWAVKK